MTLPAASLAEAPAPRPDPRLLLRWLPAAPSGEAQAALPEVPEKPGAPVPPAKGARAEEWDARRGAQAAFREKPSAWKAAAAARPAAEPHIR